MNLPLQPGEVFRTAPSRTRPHTLGISTVASLLREANHESVVGGRAIAEAIDSLNNPRSAATLITWLREYRVTRLGLSCRLDPRQAVDLIERLRFELQSSGHYGPSAQQIRGLYFAWACPPLATSCELASGPR